MIVSELSHHCNFEHCPSSQFKKNLTVLEVRSAFISTWNTEREEPNLVGPFQNPGVGSPPYLFHLMIVADPVSKTPSVVWLEKMDNVHNFSHKTKLITELSIHHPSTYFTLQECSHILYEVPLVDLLQMS